mmetsp:Transcript_1730/g.4781  ORF Transcript_1730/g.4781 Transcript_1730/m.4781 type:complete len:146 (+) Transcript_1730:268-705(+)
MAAAQGEGGLDKGEQDNITERRLDEEQVDEADCGEKATLFIGCSYLMCELFVCVAICIPIATAYNWYQWNYLYNVAIAAEIRKETHGFLQVPNLAEHLQDKKVLRAEWASDVEAGSAVASYLFGAHVAVEVFLDTFMQVIEPLVA